MDPNDIQSQRQSHGRVACDAETQRRDGNPSEARKLAEEALGRDETPGLRVALALALLDLGEGVAARQELERAFALLEGFTVAPETSEPRVVAAVSPVEADPLGEIADTELESAFLEAESNPDEMWNANHLAEAALNQIEEGVPEGVAMAPDSPFATATVAGLLEQQGHVDEAQALREAIGSDGRSAGTDDRARIIATLERWLDNLRRAS